MLITKTEIGELILLKFLIEEGNYSRKQKLLQQLNISNSTLKRYIQSLNDTFTKIKEFHTIEVLTLKDGYLLKNPTPFNGNYIIKKINLLYHSHSIHFELLNVLFLEPSQSLFEISNKLSISIPYLYKLLQLTNKYLSPFQIRVEYVNNKNKVVLTGTTTNILLFELHFYFSIYQSLNWIFDWLTLDEIYSFFSASELEELFQMSLAKQSKYFYSLALFTKLHNMRKKIILPAELSQLLILFMNEKDLSGPLKRAFSVQNDSKKDSLNDFLFFNYLHRVFNSLTDSEEVQIEIGRRISLLDKENRLAIYCKQFIDELFLEFPEINKLAQYDVIRYRLFYFLTLFFSNIFYIEFDSSNLQNFLFINPDISIHKTTLFHRITTFVSSFLEQHPLINNKRISTYHMNLLCSLLDYFISKTAKKKLTIYIQFSKNLYGEMYIESWLEKLFGEQQIEICRDINQANIVISDFFESPNQNSRYFYFDDVTDKNNWKQLYSFVHEQQMKLLE